MALKIKGLLLGEGRPKICVPITAKGEGELEQQIENIKRLCCEKETAKTSCVDMLEWRADFWEDIEDEESRRRAVGLLRQAFPEMPLLFTFRSKAEGGEKEFSWEGYEELCTWVLEEEMAELLDVELFAGNKVAERILAKRKKNGKQGIAILLSNHDFQKTPAEEELVGRLLEMERLGADILKIAVMPQKAEDVLTLLGASLKARTLTEKPVVTMSMGKLGLVSRLAGSVFGSAITFGTAGAASAPGQIEAKKLLEALKLFA